MDVVRIAVRWGILRLAMCKLLHFSNVNLAKRFYVCFQFQVNFRLQLGALFLC